MIGVFANSPKLFHGVLCLMFLPEWPEWLDDGVSQVPQEDHGSLLYTNVEKEGAGDSSELSGLQHPSTYAQAGSSKAVLGCKGRFSLKSF